MGGFSVTQSYIQGCDIILAYLRVVKKESDFTHIKIWRIKDNNIKNKKYKSREFLTRGTIRWMSVIAPGEKVLSSMGARHH